MLTRRDFIKRCRDISVAVIGAEVFATDIAEGFMRIAAAKRPQIVFVQGQSCTGCSVSMTYGNETDFIDFVTRLVRVQVHPNLSFSQGHGYIQQLEEVTSAGGHVLVLEGSIPQRMKKACLLGEEPLYDALKKHIQKAYAVVACGTCAVSGGIPASGRNETGAIDIEQYMRQQGISKPLIKIPGCPAHPDRLMGTVAYILGSGKMPPMKDGVPQQYFGNLIHNNCTRFQYFSQDIYLKDFETDKHSCLLKKGCRGTITKSDCPTRRWNGSVSVCVESNAPCVGCTHNGWPFKENIYYESRNIEDLPWNDFKKNVLGGGRK